MGPPERCTGRYDTTDSNLTPYLGNTGTKDLISPPLGDQLYLTESPTVGNLLDLCAVTNDNGGAEECSYSLRLTVADRCIVGRVSGYSFSTNTHIIYRYSTFYWDPDGEC